MLLGRVCLGLLAGHLAASAPVDDNAPAAHFPQAGIVVAARQASVSSPPVGPADDVTVTVFQTTTEGSESTVTAHTTVFQTVLSTILLTVTDIATKTVTNNDVDTATSIVFVTETAMAKRWVVVEPVLIPTAELPLETTLPGAPPEAGIDWAELARKDLEKRARLLKRATVTVTEVITVIVDGVKTVVDAVTSTVVGTTTAQTHITSTITTTTYLNAKTTVTVTSTITTTSTSVDVGGPTTVASVTATGNYGNGNSGGLPTQTGASSPSGSSSGELSTGAKAGIGAGVGAAALAVIGLLVFMFVKKRRANRVDPSSFDDMGGMSEVPVAGSPPASNVGMASTPGRNYGRESLAPPPRGGANEIDGTGVAAWKGRNELGDTHSRADTTPELMSAEVKTVSPGPSPRPGTTEIDSTPVQRHSVGPVYEMPSQPYR